MKKVIHIKILNGLLRQHNGHTLIELMSILDVEERTIRKDLKQKKASFHKDMETCLFCIVTNCKNVYFPMSCLARATAALALSL